MPVSERKRVQRLLKRSEELRRQMKRREVSDQEIQELVRALNKGVERIESEIRKGLLRKRLSFWEDRLNERSRFAKTT
ncbi:MAG: hypothetical protein ABIF06_02145 [bacterium]